MTKNILRPLHVCRCLDCRRYPTGATAQLHAGINHVVAALDEKNRRRFIGLWAAQLGHGGIQYMVMVTGLDRATIRRGAREMEVLDQATGSRVRAAGGGRQAVAKKSRRS